MADQTTRLCGFCLTQVPVSELDDGGTQCIDYIACRARADARYLYPLSEDRSTRPPVRRRVAAPDPPELAGPARGDTAVAAQPVRDDAWLQRYVRDFPELEPLPPGELDKLLARAEAVPAAEGTQRRATRREVSPR